MSTPGERLGARVSISVASTSRLLAGVVAMLVLVSAFEPVMRFGFGHDHVLGLAPLARGLFFVDDESNVTTWFSSALLLVAALLLAVIGLAHRQTGGRFARRWLGLAGIFLYLAVDEAAALHDRVQQPLREALGATGVWYHTWVVLGLAVVIIVGASYLRFLAALPAGTRAWFLAAGALYVGGALGMEMASGYYATQMGTAWPDSVTRVVLAHAEELLEMIGTVAFIHALLVHVRDHVGPIRLDARA